MNPFKSPEFKKLADTYDLTEEELKQIYLKSSPNPPDLNRKKYIYKTVTLIFENYAWLDKILAYNFEPESTQIISYYGTNGTFIIEVEGQIKRTEEEIDKEILKVQANYEKQVKDYENQNIIRAQIFAILSYYDADHKSVSKRQCI